MAEMLTRIPSCTANGITTLQNHYPNYSFDIFTEHAKSQLREKNQTSQCFQDLNKITISPSDPTPGTLSFLLKDVWGEPPSTLSGYAGGNSFAAGDRLGCYQASSEEIPTVYCRTNYALSNPFASAGYSAILPGRHLVQGACLPKSCADEPVLTENDNFFPEDFFYSDGKENGTVCDVKPWLRCEPMRSWTERCDLNGSECWIGFSWFAVLYAAVFISSVFFVFKRGFKTIDLKKIDSEKSTPLIPKQTPNLFIEVIGYFSVQRNWKELVSFKKNPRQMDSMNGMRVLAIIWVITLHIQNLVTMPLWNGTKFNDNVLTFGAKISDTFGYNMIAHGEAAVDTFFVMGGFLAAQILYRKISSLERAGGVGFSNSFLIQSGYYFNLIIHRWLRFLPVICVCVFISYVAPIWGDRFQDEILHQFEETCKITTNAGTRQVDKSWLSLVFMFQTFTNNAGQGCAGWMWYVVDEFWYYFVLVGITFGTRYFERNSRGCWPIYVIYSVLIGFSPIYKIIANAYCGEIVRNHPEDWTKTVCDGVFSNLYFTPWCRASAYFQGALAGFLLKDKRYFIKLTKAWQFLVYFACWITVGFSICLFIWLQMTQTNEWGYGSIGYIIFDSCKHEVWATFIIATIILCEYVVPFTNNFPVWFLKHKFWWFPSRINFACYAVHYYICAAVISMYPKTITLTYNIWWQDVLISTLTAYFVGFIVYLIAEAPFAKLVEKFINQPFKNFIVNASKSSE